MAGNPVNAAARAAARRLAPKYGTALEAQVEAALYARSTGQQPDQYVDPTALGTLIVSAATLAWTIYKDQREMPHKPTRETLTEQLRDHLQPDETDPSADPEGATESDLMVEVIEIIIDEIIKDAEE